MKKNTGVEYELWTKEIYKEILNQEGFPGASINHNITINGLTTSHQIDIYVSYSLAGTTHAIAFECKDYQSRISQDKIMAFYSKINDIREVTKGIFVAKNGFQKGAINFAQAHGIELVELREPKEIDWEGLVKTIEVNLAMMYANNVEVTNIKFNNEWLKENQIKEIIIEYHDTTDNIFIFNSKFQKFKSLYNLIEELPILERKEGIYTHTYNFNNSHYILDNKNNYLKLDSITFTYEVCIHNEYITVNGDKEIKAIQKYPLQNKSNFIKNK